MVDSVYRESGVVKSWLMQGISSRSVVSSKHSREAAQTGVIVIQS